MSSETPRPLVQRLRELATEIEQGSAECRQTHDEEQVTLKAEGDPDAPMSFGCHVCTVEAPYAQAMREAADTLEAREQARKAIDRQSVIAGLEQIVDEFDRHHAIYLIGIGAIQNTIAFLRSDEQSPCCTHPSCPLPQEPTCTAETVSNAPICQECGYPLIVVIDGQCVRCGASKSTADDPTLGDA